MKSGYYAFVEERLIHQISLIEVVSFSKPHITLVGMGTVERLEEDWPNHGQNQSYLVKVNDQQVDVRHSSSVSKLPLIQMHKSTSPLPRRKNAIVARAKVTDDKTNANDLPPLSRYQSSEGKRTEAKRSLSIPVSPSALGREKDGGKKPVSAQPISPRSRTRLPSYPLQRRQFLSTVDSNFHFDTTKKEINPEKAVSLDDITLESRRSGDYAEQDGLFGREGQLWSRHWYCARKSIGAIPQERDIVEMEILSSAFNQRLRKTSKNQIAGGIAIYGIQEPDIMNNEKTVENARTLEERLASIERQQGLSTTS